MQLQAVGEEYKQQKDAQTPDDLPGPRSFGDKDEPVDERSHKKYIE